MMNYNTPWRIEGANGLPLKEFMYAELSNLILSNWCN